MRRAFNALQVDLERTLAAPGQRRGLVEAALGEAEMLDRLALALGQGRHRGGEATAVVAALEPSPGSGPSSAWVS